jgi:nucleotide-binding universal stress UspA family protein
MPLVHGNAFASPSIVITFRRLLVPVDFTETSDRALAYAIELARKFGSAITVMHAYQIPVYGFPDAAYITASEVAAQISNAAQARLDAIIEANKTAGIEMNAILRDGVAWEEVNTIANEIHADLIIIGTHGRRGLARALLGSVAENVIRTSGVPVLVIHGPRET